MLQHCHSNQVWAFWHRHGALGPPVAQPRGPAAISRVAAGPGCRLLAGAPCRRFIYNLSIFSTKLKSVLCWRDWGKEKEKRRVLFFLTHELSVKAFFGVRGGIFVKSYLSVRKEKMGRGELSQKKRLPAGWASWPLWAQKTSQQQQQDQPPVLLFPKTIPGSWADFPLAASSP